jgi:DNA-binding transcriptional LysR family regulator
MDQRQLEFFLTICQEKSLFRAAERCFITQQGLSKSMQRLEKEFGAELFIRSNKGVELTEFGRVLRDMAAPFIDQYDRIRNAVHFMKQKMNHVSIGMMTGLTSTLPGEFFKRFLINNPDVYLDISTFDKQNVQESLIKDKLELGFFNTTPDPAFFTIHKSKKMKMVLVIPKDHRFAKRQSIKLADLKDEPLLVLNDNQHITDICLQRGLRPRIHLSLSEIDLARELCETNRAVFFRAAYHGGFPNLTTVEVADMNLSIELYFVSNKQTHSSPPIGAASRFIEYTVKDAFWNTE